ncbi:hypothetical protein JL720_12038 [Aureococcus anophagefferens]|nr:hypothetical protein JL720_12038 [Aureococcus anophagefferens]
MVPTTRAPSTNVATTASPTTRAPSTNVETTASPTTRARSFLPTLYPTIVATTGDTFEVNGSASFAGMTAERAAANEGVFRVALADVAGVEDDDSLALDFSSGARRRLDEASSSFEMIYTVAVAENAAAENVASNIDAATIDSMDSAIAAAAESADLAAAFRNLTTIRSDPVAGGRARKPDGRSSAEADTVAGGRTGKSDGRSSAEADPVAGGRAGKPDGRSSDTVAGGCARKPDGRSSAEANPSPVVAPEIRRPLQC